MIRKRVIGCVALVILAALTGRAQNYEWTGAGGDDSWGTANNWTNNAVPAAVFTGRVAFVAADLGGTNKLETGRTVVGTVGSLTQGLRYNIGAANTNLTHTTDLDGNTLVLNGGSLQVGYGTNNSSVVIQNGTLQLGGLVAADVYVGVVVSSTSWFTGNALRVTATINATNLQSIFVARNSSGNDPAVHGHLDLSGATIRSGADADVLRLKGDLWVGYGGGALAGRYYKGTVLLPASLKSLDVRDLFVGHDRSSIGTLDFGSGSALTNLNVRGNFGLSDWTGQGFLLNLPSNIVFTVGTNSGLNTFVMAHMVNSSLFQNTTTGTLVLTKGRFIGRLSDLTLGYNASGNPGVQTALLDLSDTDVQIGDEPNKVKVGTLLIGSRGFPNGEGDGKPTGTLKLPSNITEIAVGNFYLGHGYRGLGYLDITSNSALQVLTVTNTLSIGGGYGGFIGYDDAGTFKEYLPPRMTVNVGLPASRAVLYVGRRAAHPSRSANGEGHLTLSNCTFSAYLSSLIVGINTDDPTSGTKPSIGTLNLRHATVGAFDIRGNAAIGAQVGAATQLGGVGNKDGKGYVYLPACSVNIASNLFIGDSNVTSLGMMDLSGTTLTIGQTCIVDRTGIVTTRVFAASCGLDIASSSTNDFQIAPSGRVHVVFTTLAPKVWGLRMAGDQRSYFQDLHDAGRLTWSASPHDAQIAYVDGKTVVRLPPVAGSLLLIR